MAAKTRQKKRPRKKRAKQSEAEKIKAFAVKVSEQFWPKYKPLFSKRAMDFPDLVQECAAEFYRVKDRYNPEYSLTTFAYTVMRNRLKNKLLLTRQKKRSAKTTSLDRLKSEKKDRKALEDKAVVNAGIGTAGLKREEILKLLDSSGLTYLEKRRLRKLFLEEKTPNEVAREEKVSSSAVTKSKRDALEKIRKAASAKDF